MQVLPIVMYLDISCVNILKDLLLARFSEAPSIMKLFAHQVTAIHAMYYQKDSPILVELKEYKLC